MAKADIQIQGRRFSIACAPGQESRVSKLGEQLDARLSGIASAVGDIGEERLLLIAALALLDELDAAKRLGQGHPGGAQAEARLLAMAARIDALANRLEDGL
ncbi:cell division protein ZapA [Hyphomonas sp.]|uniref:cell division protein ZapA n=1 Tax=Hyphomonas sp. TaxID=87 RepID=UPI00391D884D